MGLSRAVLKAYMLVSIVTLSTGYAHAADSPRDAILTPIVNMVAAVNSGKPMPPQLFTPDAVIIDEFPPFKWTAPAAETHWYNDLGTFVQKVNMQSPHITLSKPQFVTTSADRAYVVIPTTFSYSMKDKPQLERGAFTFTLLQAGPHWQISSCVWAKTYDSTETAGK